jgi:malonyl-CoA/methylmalonyl-CoA synthetase
MILYTSGTTNLPKGVVTTHAAIQAQVTSLIKAWKWTANDHILCVLPLHHVHGIINVVTCALWSGAKVEFLPAFDARIVFELFMQGKINVFMAVPTIYYKLITYWDSLSAAKQIEISSCLSTFRLMVSGSAALPITTLEKWKEISNHILLERYGMTEIGMAISNPYDGLRKPGYIGKPLPGVKIRLADENNHPVKGKKPGEIQIKGKNVFQEYWAKPDATAKAFTDDGWFKSGDIAIKENGYYKILGRDSIDIIKSGGYKISALEIEDILRKHPQVKDCSVIGVPDEEWGEKIAAVLLTDGTLVFEDLNTWIRSLLPGYKIPRLYKIIDELPRNAMGKVTKNDLKKLFV